MATLATSVAAMGPIFRTESMGHQLYMEQNNAMLEKRQLFLRSYQFSRKRSLRERIRWSLCRVKRVVRVRFRSARRIRRRMGRTLLKLRRGLCCYRRRWRFLRNGGYYNNNINNTHCDFFWQ